MRRRATRTRIGHAGGASSGLSSEQREAADAALHRYGAHLTADNFIARGDKVLSVQLEVRKGRLRMLGGGNLLASFHASRIPAGVSQFVERFWYWSPS